MVEYLLCLTEGNDRKRRLVIGRVRTREFDRVDKERSWIRSRIERNLAMPLDVAPGLIAGLDTDDKFAPGLNRL